ncbi:MAG: hypothetical protein MZV49_08115 [Rhodopseudomonas palustris]|nr:hypothetical protein [Rhodopseudomonas palustris]
MAGAHGRAPRLAAAAPRRRSRSGRKHGTDPAQSAHRCGSFDGHERTRSRTGPSCPARIRCLRSRARPILTLPRHGWRLPAMPGCRSASTFLMNAAATLIAGYGLLANSEAVVIGAMLIATCFRPWPDPRHRPRARRTRRPDADQRADHRGARRDLGGGDRDRHWLAHACQCARSASNCWRALRPICSI